MDFDKVYRDYIKSEEPNDDAIAEDFKKFCQSQKYIKPHYGLLAMSFESKMYGLLESRKLLDSDGEDLLRDMIEYCVVKGFNLNPDYVDVYLDTSRAGYMFCFYSEYDNICGTLGISVNPVTVAFVDDKNEDTTIKELRIEDLLTYGFDNRLMRIIIEAIKNKVVYTYRPSDDYESPMEFILDHFDKERPNDSYKMEIAKHWVGLGLIDHVPTEEEILNFK